MTDWMPQVRTDYDRPLELEADAVVVGSGAGGAVLASELAEAGRSVVLLEKGGYHTRKDFDQQELASMQRLYEEAGARTTADGGIVTLAGATVGGGTTVNWAICFDPPEKVLEAWSTRFGIASVRLEDVRESLARVRQALNVQVMAPEAINENGRLFLAGARKLGLHAHPVEQNRTDCLRSGFCMLGCAYDRKQSMLVTYVPRALQFGARLLPRARVERLEMASGRFQALSGTLTNPTTGRTFPFRVRAKIGALAAGAIATPLLLQKHGLGGPLVGENLCLHPTTAAVGVFDHEVRAAEGIHYTGYLSDLEPEGIIVESAFALPGLTGASSNAWGAHGAELMANYTRIAGGIVMLFDEGRGRVHAGPGGDPQLDYWLTPGDIARLRKGLTLLARLYFAAGARRVILPHSDGVALESAAELDKIARMPIEPCRLALFSGHMMGTAALGRVTDSWGRVQGTENLFVADGSLFPTPLGVNPTLTIATLADRLAGHLLAGSYFA